MGKHRKRNCSHLLDTGIVPVKRLKSSNNYENDGTVILHSDYEYEESYYKYTNQSILPSMQELTVKDHISPHVKPLPRNGKYKNWQQYLSLQFNLLREDFIAPLRKGILNYKTNGDNHQTDVKVYNEATFTRMEFKNDGIILCVSFEAHKNVSFAHQINGSLLCFSSDNFETALFATVATGNRDEKSVNEEEVLVKVISNINYLSILGIDKDGWILEQKVYTMVELVPHFETYDCVLRSLQSFNPKTMPFTKYFIDCNYSRMPHPPYLRRNSVFNMKMLLATETKHPYYFNITNSNCWPSDGDTVLNKAQKKAIQKALTQEVSLIQGPPGTGKTHVAKTIIEILLGNMKHQRNSPILVVCYKNQALDQLLEKTVEFKKSQASKLDSFYHGGLQKYLSFNPRQIVRLGRGSNQTAMNYSLHCLEKVDKISRQKKMRKKRQKNDNERERLGRLTGKIACLNKKAQCELNFLQNKTPSIKVLSEFIDPIHLVQLHNICSTPDNCIKVWLKRQGNFNKYSQSNKCRSFLRVVNLCETQVQVVYTEAEVKRITDITVLSRIDKEKLLYYWVNLYHQNHYNKLCNLIDEYNEIYKVYWDLYNKKTIETLQRAHVIFATTTGIAKNKHLIEKVQPKIIIVEEAAEVLESHIASCLTAATQQLILIGDHKQLEPKPYENALALKYRLNISLFERLISANFPSVTLQYQHRMRPEIANLIRPHIYSKLKDTDKVSDCKDIKGVASNMYFFDHSYLEDQFENSTSYYNDAEAHLIAELCDYLLKQDYKPSEITILAAYKTQVEQIIRLIPEAVNGTNDKGYDASDTKKSDIDKPDGVVVTTIDNFQGKENDIIILSLVRNNKDDIVGFLSKQNRTCVALSRAKKGLYCFGNFRLLSDKSPTWKEILLYLEKNKQVGSKLQLKCANHPESITTITKYTDFKKLPPEGGCWLKCDSNLPFCEHKCTKNCHIKDKDHKMYKCKQPCLRKCIQCGNPCRQKCFMKCERCEALVKKKVPSCGHIQLVPCWMKPDEFKCQNKCNKTCTNGHPCPLKCSEECGDCPETSVEIRNCGHEVTLYCSENYAMPTTCHEPCKKMCTTNKNPHKCTKLCSEICGNCESPVEVTLPWCGHRQEVPCYMQHRLKHYANKICCNTEVEKVVPSCGHRVTIPCGKDARDFDCHTLVYHKLPCGHSKGIECYRLQGISKECLLASEKCQVEVKKVFSLCNHTINLPCSDRHIEECPVKCEAVLLCGHRCFGNCHECHQGRLHKPCMFHANKLLCGHQTTVNCGSSISQPYPKCSYRCERYCPHTECSHKCQDACKPCHKPCRWRCEHYRCTRKCFESCNRQRCYHPCPRINKCGHQCIGVCGEPCPQICNICDDEKFSQLYVSLNKFKTKYNTRYIQLNCGHLFKVTELDPWIDAHSKHFQLISCPKCETIIHFYHRYGNAIRRAQENINEILCEVNHTVTLSISSAKPEKLSLSIDDFENIPSSTKHYIFDSLDSLKCLKEFSKRINIIQRHLDTLVMFLKENAKSLSLQTIQDVTCEQRRIALWIMTYQLNNKRLDHADMSTVEQVENFITKLDYVHHNKRLFPQQAKILYTKLSNIAKRHKVTLLDKKYIQTPMLPVMYTGKWRQCHEGHFYCIPQPPPDIWCEFLTTQRCPICWEQYEDESDSEELMDTDGQSD